MNGNFGIHNIFEVSNAKSRSISAENPKGLPGEGGKESSNLGKSRKGSPCIDVIEVDENRVIAEIEGPGIIQSFWFTMGEKSKQGSYMLRDLVLKIYWDGESEPSVEVPIGDFFCNGFGKGCEVNSMPIVVAPSFGFNCFFPMPFKKKAKIVLHNQHPGIAQGIFYQINYSLVDSLPDTTAYFHAQWRRENPTKTGKDYVILDGVAGKGHYVGTYIAWAALGRYWWGEGEIKFYIDKDDKYPTICGTGTEDYFGGAWCFYDKKKDGTIYEKTYCTPYIGYPFNSKTDTTMPHIFGEDSVPMHGLYRWHLMDPIRFDERIKVTIQQMGYNGRELFERSDDVSSTAYWYQLEPHASFPKLLPAKERWPR